MQPTDSLNSGTAKPNPSNSHLSPVVQLPVETARTSVKQVDIAPKSHWLQRFKIRDEAEEVRRKPAEVDCESPVDALAASSKSLHPSNQAGQRTCVEDGGASIREGQADALQEEKASTKPDQFRGDQGTSNVEESNVPDASRPILSKQKDRAGGLQNQGFADSKEVVAGNLTGGVSTAPLKSGFGPWIKAKAVVRPEEKSQLEAERTGQTVQRVFHSFGTSNILSPLGSTQTSMQAGEREQGAAGGTSRLTNSLWRSGSGGVQTDEVAHASRGKPPLPPPRPGTSNRGTPKFGSRPSSFKAPSLPFLPGRLSPSVKGIPVSDRVLPDSQLVGPLLHMSTTREGVTTRKVLGVDEARLTRVIGETDARGCTSLEEPSPSKSSCMDLGVVQPKERETKCVETGRHQTVGSTSQAAVKAANMVSSDKVVPAIDFPVSKLYKQSAGRKSGIAHSPPIFTQHNGELSEGTGAIIAKGKNLPKNAIESTGLPSTPAATDFPLELQVPNVEESKIVTSDEVLPNAVGGLNGDALQPKSFQRGGTFEAFDSSRRVARLDEANEVASEPARSSTSTAKYSWGLFTGAAATSSKAREHFVEVYNRARDDLKNQQTSQIISRIPDKDMGDSPRPASELMVPKSKCRSEKLALEGQKQPVQNLLCQERFETLNGEPEPTLEPVAQGGKSLNLRLLEREQSQSGRQSGGVAEVNVWGSQDKGFQTFQTSHGVDGRACPTVDTGPAGNLTAVPVIGFVSNTLSSRQGETIILSKHSEGLKEAQLQFRANPNISQERSMDLNNNCHRKVEQRSDKVVQLARADAIMNIHNEGFLHKSDLVNIQKVDRKIESSLSRSLANLGGVSNNREDRKHGFTSLLGKRPRGVFPDIGMSGICASEDAEVFIDGSERPRSEMPLKRPHVWIQRWQSTPHSVEGMQGHTRGHFNVAGQHTYGDFTLGSFRIKDTNSNKLVGQTPEIRRSFAEAIEREQEVKFFQTGSAKVLPSPAAMAIVGIATRQFCSAQLQRKGCFSFW